MLMSTSPLSKFGIEAQFRFTTSPAAFLKEIGSTNVYTYTSKDTHKYKNHRSSASLVESTPNEIIVSKIKVNLNESDYE